MQPACLPPVDLIDVLADAAESLTEGLAIYDPGDRLLYCNRAYRELFRNTPEFAVIGSPFADALRAHVAAGRVPAAIGRTEAFIEERLAFHRNPGPPVDVEIEHGRWARVAKRRTDGGNTVCTFTDITNVKATEEQLRRRTQELEAMRDAARLAEQRFVDAVEAMDDPFTICDAKERLVLCNEAFRRYAGYVSAAITPGSTIEQGLRALAALAPQLADPEDQARFVAHRLAIYRSNVSPVDVRTGRDSWSRVSFRRTPDGGSVSVITDISELKRRERELEAARDLARRVEERLTQAIEALSDPFAIFDANETMVVCNAAFRRLYDDDPASISPGTPIIVALERRARQLPFLKTEEHRRDFVAQFLGWLRACASGPEFRAWDRWMRVLVRPLPEGGRVTLFADVTVQKQREAESAAARDIADAARREAEEANRAKSTFLATMSHEIRTPMNGVLGMMEVLEQHGLTSEQRELMQIMRDSATALLRIIDDVLDFSKIEVGRLDLEAISFSPRDLVEGAVDTLTVQASRKRLSLVSDIDIHLPEAVIGDPTRVRQILFNLIGNAIKFTDRGFVRVVARAHRDDGSAELTLGVEDTGIGMTPVEIDGLFMPFTQAASSTTRRFGGTGLGLSIVRRLVELMGGSIAVESASGRGSTFTVTLKLALAAASAESPEESSMSETARRWDTTRARGHRALVVDDHPVNREVLARQLDMLGLASEQAADGAEALNKWRAGGFAVLLVDVQMPVMDGLELTRHIRAEERGTTRRTPIVAITANALKGEADRCLGAGMDSFLTKPTTLARLRSTLARWLAVEDDAVGPAGGPPPVNRDALRMLFGDDQATIDRLIATFIESANTNQAEIGSALTAGNLGQVAAAAHRIKGAARMLGAAGTGDAAAALEQAARAADRAHCDELAGRLATEIRRVAGATAPGLMRA